MRVPQGQKLRDLLALGLARVHRDGVPHHRAGTPMRGRARACRWRRARTCRRSPPGRAIAAGSAPSRDPNPGELAIAAVLAAVRARAAQHDVVLGDRVLQAPREPVDRLLERRVLERGHLAAAVAHDVVMVVTARERGLVAGGASRRRGVAPGPSAQAGRAPGRRLRCRPRGPSARSPSKTSCAVRQQAWRRHQVDHRRAGAAAAVTGPPQLRRGVLGPFAALALACCPSTPIIDRCGGVMVMRTVPIIWYTSPRGRPARPVRPAVRPARAGRDAAALGRRRGARLLDRAARPRLLLARRRHAPPSPAWCSRTASASPPRSAHSERPPRLRC